MFFGAPIVASIFVSAEDAVLLSLASHGIRLFCFAYLFRWFGVMTQSFFSAIEKPVLATVMAVSIALVFPVLCLGAFWNLGLDGLWLNFVGTNVLAAILGVILLIFILRMIKRKEAGMDADPAPEDV
jgi:Na+-driven multidrug efflux pump